MNVEEMFEKHSDEYIKFENVPLERKLSNRPDLCAFLLLEKLVPDTTDIVASAEHDEIFLGVDLDALEKVATEEDIITLIRCGVHYNSEYNALTMFV